MKCRFIIAILFLSSMLLAAQSDPVLEQYIQQALSENPSLKAAITRVESFDEMIPQAGVLPDPMLGLGVTALPVNTFRFNQEEMTGKWISIGQMFPFPGKLGLKRDIAKSQRDQQLAMLESEKASLIRQVKETYYNWAYNRASIQVVEANQSLMDQFVDIALSKYKVGNGLQQDVLRAQTERTRFEERLLELHQMEATLKSRMNTLLNRNPDAELEAPLALDFDFVAIHPDSIQSAILNNNPELLALHFEQQSADHEIALARKDYYPDVKLGVMYMQRDDAPNGRERTDFVSFEAGIDLPLHWKSKQDRSLQQKRLERRSVDEQYQHLVRELEFQTSDLLSQEKRIRDQIDLYQNGIIPQARQTLESTIAAYQVGKVDFLTLLSNQMALLDYELELKEKVLEYQLVWSSLEALTGQRIL